MRNGIIVFLITLVLLHISSLLSAQQGVQTVKRTTSKNIPLSKNDVLSIIGEKASISINGWNKNYIQLKITFLASHADKKIAAQELEFMHYALSREKNIVELRNAFVLSSKTDQIYSKLEVLIEVMLPAANELIIKNKYGDMEIQNTSGKINASLEFSDLNISNVSGEVMLQSLYSEIRGSQLMTSSFISKDEESKYILALEKGSYSFNSKHGDLDFTVKDIASLIIDGIHTDVTIRPKEFTSYNYQLLSKDGKIYLPRQYTREIKKEGKQSSMRLQLKQTNPLIKIKTTFNTITIQ